MLGVGGVGIHLYVPNTIHLPKKGKSEWIRCGKKLSIPQFYTISMICYLNN